MKGKVVIKALYVILTHIMTIKLKEMTKTTEKKKTKTLNSKN